MKLRIKSNSVRLRLSQDEVQELVSKFVVTDSCAMSGGKLDYGIRAKEANQMEVQFEANSLIITIPSAWIKEWGSNEKVGFDGTMSNGTYVLVEKDFKCLIPREKEDESSLYPNPKA